MSSYWKINEPDVVWECVDAEMVLIDFRTGCYFSVAGVGTDVVKLLAAGLSTAQVQQLLAQAFGLDPQQVVDSIEQFVGQLVHEGLLAVLPPSPAAPPLVYRPVCERFAPPQLEKFDDMADQLLLDPIHEIDEFGPSARAAA